MGKSIRNNERYKDQGVNVNFVQIIEPNFIKVRTYERGVEDETLSCGTGCTAAAIALAFYKNLPDNSFDINIETLGGNLSVSF